MRDCGPSNCLARCRRCLKNQDFDDAFRSAPGGADWDVLPIIKMLVEAATFIKTCLDIQKYLHDVLGRKPSKEELTEGVEVKKLNAPEHVRQKVEYIILMSVISD